MDTLDCSAYAADQSFLLQQLRVDKPPISKAWSCLDVLFKRRILSYHYQLVRDDDKRETAYYDAITVFWEKVKNGDFKIEGKDSILKYIGVAFKNNLFHVARDHKRAKVYVEIQEEHSQSDPVEDITSEIDLPLRVAHVENLLMELPHRQRKLVNLLHIERRSQEEVIEELSISYGSYRNLKVKAMKNLKELYKKWRKEGRI